MMRTFSTMRLAVSAVCGLLAATMLSGCWVTSGDLETRLTKFKTEDLAETQSQVQSNTSKVAAVESSVTAIGKEVEALKELRTKLEDLGSKVDDITKKLAALDGIPARVAASETSVSQLRKDAETAKASRAELLAGLSKAALKTDLDKLAKSTDDNVARLDNKDKELTGKDTELAGGLSKLEKIAEALVTDVKTIKVFAARLDTEMKDLTKKTTDSMAAQDKKIASIGGGVSTALTKEIGLLEKRITTLKDVLKGLGSGASGGGPATRAAQP